MAAWRIRLVVLVALLFQFFLVYEFVARNRRASLPAHDGALKLPVDPLLGMVSDRWSPAPASSCPFGFVYVYELPPEFNADLLTHCRSIIPWISLCPALAQDGIGIRLQLPSWILPVKAWHLTNQFGGEVIFHSRMLAHRCRTLNPAHASAFFVPFYAGLDLTRHLWVPSTAAQRDALALQLIQWLLRQPSFVRRGGWDHFLMVGRITWDFRRFGDQGWGSRLANMVELQNMTRLTIERSPWDAHEMGVPYPTSFHPRVDSDVAVLQRLAQGMRRSILMGFAGALRPGFKDDFRATLFQQCRHSSANGSCRYIDCSDSKCEHPLPTLELFLDSSFCLQPRGDSYTRRSVFDSMIVGCIPVFFWRRTAYEHQYDWHLPGDARSYSVFIDKDEVQSGVLIEHILRSLPEARVAEMRKNLVKMIPNLVYAAPGNHLKRFNDAFDIAVQGVLRRMRQYTGQAQPN